MGAVTWQKPKPMTWHMDSDCGRWRIGKALVNGEPRYTLARLGGKHPVLVIAGSLDECKAAAR